jgi:hypothetical protein
MWQPLEVDQGVPVVEQDRPGTGLGRLPIGVQVRDQFRLSSCRLCRDAVAPGWVPALRIG